MGTSYPYAKWPRVSRDEVRLLRRFVRALPLEGADRARAEAEALLGCALTIAPGAAQWLSSERAGQTLAASPTALWLVGSAAAPDTIALCAMAPDFTAQLVERVLGGEGRVAHPPGVPLDALSTGVLAYLGARVFGALGADLRVASVVQAHDQALALLGQAPVLALPVAIALAGGEAGSLQLLVPAAAAARVGETAVPAAVPAALRSLPLTLCAHAATVTLTRAELETLAPGDVVVPERCRLARDRDGAGFAGEVVLHVTGGRRTRFRCSARSGQLTIETVEHDQDARSAMSDAKRIPTKAIAAAPEAELSQLAGDAPIELCLELARFTLALDELSALRPGEVLTTGRAIGARVALSAAGRTVARGELCEVDGEIGVRITEVG